MKTIWMRRPQAIEAVEFNGKNFNEILEFVGEDFGRISGKSLMIKCGDSSSEYELDVMPGYYVVKDNVNPDYPFGIMDGNTLNALYAPVSRGRVSEIECTFYKETMKHLYSTD